MKDWEYHPLAMELTPPMAPEQFAKLKESIRLRGVRKPAMQFEGMLLDGRHRHRALTELRAQGLTKAENGVDLDLIVRDEPSGWTQKDAALFVADENLHRRQMTKEQLQAKAVSLVKILEGPAKERQIAALTGAADEANASFQEAASPSSSREDDEKTRGKGRSVEKAAAVTGLSKATVERAVAVDKKGTDELKDALAKGEIKAKPAAALANKPAAEQRAAVAKIRGEEPPAAAPPADPSDPTAAPPAHLAAVFDSVTVSRGLIQRLTKWENDFDEACRAIGFRRIAAEQLPHKTQIEKLRTLLQSHVPYGVCPSCEGKQDAKCKTCDSLGWVNKATFRRLCPEESRASVYRVS